MERYRITPIRLGTITRPVSNMLYASEDQSPFRYPLVAYYLESDAHRIMVDTGGSVPADNWHQPYTREPDEEMGAALAKIGVSPDDVDMVLFTHLHWDHAQNNHCFVNARFIAQKAEVEAFLSGEDKGYEEEEFGKTRYETIDGDVDVVDGISAYAVPGHSKGSQAFVVDVDGGKALITGDLVPRYVNWFSEPKIPNGGYDDYDAMTASYAKLAEIAERLGISKIYPGHEPELFE